MKTLNNHTIYYDNDCPMCAMYSRAMVKTGMLDERGRAAYSEAACAFHPSLDAHRAKNEIALVNHQTNEVTYGIDSLIAVVGHRFPWLKPVFGFRLLRPLYLRLYRLISYNRKVIAPPSVFEEPGSCTPDLNLKYRWTYITIAWVITSLILLHYSALMYPLVPETNSLREFAICGGQLIFQALIVWWVRRERVIHYLGNMMTISLAGALALLPVLVLGQWLPMPDFVFAGYFMAVVGGMLLEHVRRVKLLGMDWRVTAGWVLYCLLVVGVILFLET